MTSVEIGGKVHSFIVEDHNHPENDKIYEELKKLNEEMMNECRL